MAEARRPAHCPLSTGCSPGVAALRVAQRLCLQSREYLPAGCAQSARQPRVLFLGGSRWRSRTVAFQDGGLLGLRVVPQRCLSIHPPGTRGLLGWNVLPGFQGGSSWPRGAEGDGDHLS